MKELGVEKFFLEKIMGKAQRGRKQLMAMLTFVRGGDVVVVECISRIAWNTKDLLKIVELLEEKGGYLNRDLVIIVSLGWYCDIRVTLYYANNRNQENKKVLGIISGLTNK